MNDITYDFYKSNLSFERQSPGKTKPPYAKRLANINFIQNLNRTGLVYPTSEKRVLFYTTAIEEKIYIQYPGKETIRFNKGTTVISNANDFRPKILLPDGTWHSDLSFGKILEVIEDIHVNRNDIRLITVLSAVIYRMAFMLDHTLHTAINMDVDDIVANTTTLTPFTNVYKYELDNNVLNTLSTDIGIMGGLSLEAYLFYIDLIGLNEDAKYYYKNPNKATKWQNGTGRINNLLSYVSFIQCLFQHIKMSELFNILSLSRGVAPLSGINVLFTDFIT